jgi:hypothetical protein
MRNEKLRNAASLRERLNRAPSSIKHTCAMRSSTLCALLALCSVSAAPRFDEAYVRARIISTEALTRGRSEMPVVARPVTAPLPAAFDARTEWSNCTVRPPWPFTNSPA